MTTWHFVRDAFITMEQAAQEGRKETPAVGTRCVVNVHPGISRAHWHQAGTVTEVDGKWAYLEYDTRVGGCDGLWLIPEQLV